MWLFVAIALADPILMIRSASDCPAASAVVAEIAPLLPPDARLAVAPSSGRDDDDLHVDSADILDDGQRRWVQLSGGDGRLIDRRELPPSLNCQEAARAAAVLLAAWQFQGRSALPLPKAEVPISVSASPAGPPRPDQIHAPPSASRNTLALGAGLAVTRGSEQFVGSAMVEILVGKADGFGLRLHAARTSLYNAAVASGRAEWTRSSLGIGVTLTGRRGGWGGQVQGGVAGGLLSISGNGYAVNETSSPLLLGATAAGRLIRRLGPADVWVGVTLTFWPGHHQVFLRDAPETRDLPTFEAAAEVGFDFVLWP